jgi:GNAT superfamily N-acetyltransferase
MTDLRTAPVEEPSYRIIAARPSDLPLVPAIELAAGTLLAGHAPASVLEETTSQADLEDAQQRGQLWVALADDVAVGFARLTLLEPGIAHLEEIDVCPEHGRRGLGRRLVITVCQWAAINGYSGVTLTTFRDVPWNMPFYARLGFDEIPPEEIGPALLSVIEDETRRGLDPGRRVAMQRKRIQGVDPSWQPREGCQELDADPPGAVVGAQYPCDVAGTLRSRS